MFSPRGEGGLRAARAPWGWGRGGGRKRSGSGTRGSALHRPRKRPRANAPCRLLVASVGCLLGGAPHPARRCGARGGTPPPPGGAAHADAGARLRRGQRRRRSRASGCVRAPLRTRGGAGRGECGKGGSGRREGAPPQCAARARLCARARPSARFVVAADPRGADARRRWRSWSFQTLSPVAALTCQFADSLSRDVKSFARHAGRSTVTVPDVSLAVRRSAVAIEAAREGARAASGVGAAAGDGGGAGGGARTQQRQRHMGRARAQQQQLRQLRASDSDSDSDLVVR